MRRDSTRSSCGAARSCAVVVWLFAGCYHAGQLECAVSCAGDTPCPGGLSCGADLLCHGGAGECGALDAGDDAPLIDARGDAPPALAYCDRMQPGLVACFELEGNANDALRGITPTAQNVTFPAGKVGRAMAINPASTVHIDDLPALELHQLTIELWVKQSSTTGFNVPLVNHDYQFGLILNTENHPVCAYFITPQPAFPFSAIAANPLPSEQWTHLACTYDGAELWLYVNGRRLVANTAGGTIVTSPTTGTDLGTDTIMPTATNRYLGLLDQIRVFSVARSEGQICLDAGNTSCPPP